MTTSRTGNPNPDDAANIIINRKDRATMKPLLIGGTEFKSRLFLGTGKFSSNEEMKKAAAFAIAALITEDELKPDYIIPSPFDKRVAPAVAKAVKEAAVKTGVNRI